MIRRALLLAVCLLAAIMSVSCRSAKKASEERLDLTLKLVHGPEMRAFLSSLRESFYLTSPKLVDGTEIKLELISEMGPVAARRIASGELKAQAWLAPSSSLVDYINKHRINLGAGQAQCQKLFGTPVVAVVRPDQEVLMAADSMNRFSWSRLMHGLASQASSETSPFELGFSHPQPQASTTGMAVLVQLAYLAAGKSSLDVDELKSPPVLTRLKGFQTHVLSYPVSENYLLSNLAAYRGTDLRFAMTTEQQLVQFNRQQQEPEQRLQALFPEEGVYWEDYQACISQADWVSAAEQVALRKFMDFMSSHTTLEAASELGFRPVQAQQTPEGSEEVSKDSRWEPLPINTLPPVSGEVVAELFGSWRQIRRPVAQVLVIDVSGSMEGDSLSAGKEQFRRLMAMSAEGDLTALIGFGSSVQVLGKLTPQAVSLVPALDLTRAVGGSAVYDAIAKAFDMVSAAELSPYRRSVLVFTDGADKNSDTSLSSLLGNVHDKAQRFGISLLIIAIDRGGSNFADLERIAQASNGSLRVSSLMDLEAVFQEVMKGI